MSCGVLWTEGRGEGEERGAVADFFLESSFVRESDLRSDYFFFFFSFFLRGWYVLLISRLKSRGEIGARDDARDEILK